MSKIIPLAKIITSDISTYHKDVTRNWGQYVEDHRDNIITGSTQMMVEPDVINEYLYRPVDFVKKYLKLNIDIHWIFMYINKIHTNMDFNTKLDRLYIPNSDMIKELRQRYIVFTTNMAKSDKVK